MLELLVGLAALYGASKVIGVSLGGKGKRAPVAPIPAGQMGLATAPSIPGHMLPTPPDVPREQSAIGWLATINANNPGWAAVDAATPYPDATGIWRDPFGNAYQFTDCRGQPMGHAGYMPLAYKAWLDAGINCSGKPMSPAKGADNTGADWGQAVSTGAQIATTAAGVAAGGGAGGAAAAVGASVAAAAAALGPLPASLAELFDGDGWKPYLTRVRVYSRPDGRTLALNVAGVGSEWTASAVEVSSAAARKIGSAGAARGTRALYADHAHAVIGAFSSESAAQSAAESYALSWRRAVAGGSVGTCACEEIQS